MILIRLRNALKQRLRKGGLLYRLLSGVHRCLRAAIPSRPRREPVEDSIFEHESELEMCSLFPKEILELVWQMYHPSSVLDVGSGTGVSLDWFLSNGAEAAGVEGSDLAVSKSFHRDRIRVHNLHEPLDLGRSFDLVWCFEVAEHIRPEFVEVFLDSLCRHGARVLLSAAPPGQGGLGHFNEQPQDYWVERMARRGFSLAEEATRCFREIPDAGLNNVMVFEERSESRSD